MKSYADKNRKYNVALGIIAAALGVVLIFIVILIVTSFKGSTPTPTGADPLAVAPVTATAAQTPVDNAQVTAPVQDPAATPAATTAPGAPATQAPAAAVTTTQAAQSDPSSWSVQEILSYTTTAVNNTKAYTGAVSCQHSEGLDGGITSITGGSIVQGIANRVIASIAAPKSETINFSNGVGTNSDGEQISLLLPNNKPFALDPAGVASARAVRNGENVDVTITLISESVDKNTAPTYNSNSIGFLDIGSLNIDAVTIDTANVTYSGSTLQYSIMPNGYVKSAVYKMPIHIEGSGKASFVSATLVVDGVENESFNFNW